LIIWINGAFGSGKTQTAHELCRRIPQSFLYDPENAGFFIRENIPNEMSKADFQDHSLWREFNFSMLKTICNNYDGVITVPMTIVNPHYFDEIIGKLRSDGVTVHHFSLCASKKVLLRRLKSRGDGINSWAANQIDRCIEGLSHPVFEHHLQTDSMAIGHVVEQIATMSNLRLDGI
jgi:cytidylate kinase